MKTSLKGVRRNTPRRPRIGAQMYLRRFHVRLREILVAIAPPALEHADLVALFREPQRRDAAAEPGADDEPVVVEVSLRHGVSLRSLSLRACPRGGLARFAGDAAWCRRPALFRRRRRCRDGDCQLQLLECVDRVGRAASRCEVPRSGMPRKPIGAGPPASPRSCSASARPRPPKSAARVRPPHPSSSASREARRDSRR